MGFDIDNSTAAGSTGGAFADSIFEVYNITVPTKRLKFSLSGSTAGTLTTILTTSTVSRSLTLPDATDTFAVLAAVQSFSNKSFSNAVGIGVTSALASAWLDIHASGVAVPHFQANNTGAQGATGGAFTQVCADPGAALLSGSRLGVKQFSGVYDASSTIVVGASISAFCTENWSVAAHGTKLTFGVTANGAIARTTALTLNQDSSATFNSSVTATSFLGPLTGNVTGNVTGNCTGTSGSFTGNLSGDVTSTGMTTSYAGTVPLNKGGTGQTTKAAAFDALSPMTTIGDVIYGGTSGTGTRLANAAASLAYLESVAGAAPAWRAYAKPTIEVLTGSSTYNAQAGAKSCIVYVTGGGGGGSDGSNNNVTGGGGGGGATAIKTYKASDLASISYVVGAAGAASGGNGGDSTFTVGGTALTGGGGTGSSAPYGGAGGTASNGDMNISGGFGTNGGNGTLAWATSGCGGSSFWGGGGRGGIAATGASENGAVSICYGGGSGGGSANSTAHGTGAAGKVGTIMIVTLFQ